MKHHLPIVALCVCILAGCSSQEEFKPKKLEACDIKTRWEIARSIIEHEDELTYQRTGSYLTMQGLLLAVIGIILKAYVDSERGAMPSEPQIVGLLVWTSAVACGIGFVSSIFNMIGLGAADNNIGAALAWWEENGGKEGTFPQIIGHYPFADAFTPYHLPAFMIGVWVFVAILLTKYLQIPIRVRNGVKAFVKAVMKTPPVPKRKGPLNSPDPDSGG